MSAKPTISLRTLTAALLLPALLKGQDIHFSQFYEVPMNRNPALAGLFSGDIRLQGGYRSQWASIGNPFQTGTFNAEYRTSVGRSDDYVTFGGQALFDKAGTVGLATNHLLPVVNYHKSMSRNRNTYLSLGFAGGLVSRRFDRSKVTTNNQFAGTAFDPSRPDGESFQSGYNYLDMSVGMSLSSTMGADEQHLFFLGAAYHHFNRPVNSFFQNIRHTPRWVFSGGLKLNLGAASMITLHGDYMEQGPSREAVVGGLYGYRLQNGDQERLALHLGGFMRLNDAFIPVVKLDMLPLTLSFSYDVSVGNVATAAQSRGGPEISIGYATYLRSEQSARYEEKCPRF